MQDLKRLAKIIAKNSPKVLPVVDQTDQSSLEGKLYHFILENDCLSDEEACAYLYGEQKLTANYRMLKSRLRKKLLNNLLFTELTEKQIRKCRIWYLECLTLIQQANKIRVVGDIVLASKIADQVIQLAKKAELNDILVQAYELKHNADLFSFDRVQFERNLEMLKHYQTISNKEFEAFIIYSKQKFEINLNISSRRKQRGVYERNLLKLKELWKTTGSSKIYDYYHLLRIGYYEVIGEYEGILNAISETEVLLDAGKVNKYWFNDHFNFYIKAYAYLRLGKLAEGLVYSEAYLSHFVEGSANWFAFLENYLLLSLHSRNYSKAIHLCAIAASKDVFEQPIVGIRERWSLFFRYVRLFIKSNQDMMLLTCDKIEITYLPKDKDGFNFSMLVLEYLEKLPNIHFEDIEYYVTRLKRYCSKYLKGEIGIRERLFIRLLVVSMNEEGIKLGDTSAPVFAELRSTQPPRDPITEVEIVPYEHLWELVLEIMQNKGQK